MEGVDRIAQWNASGSRKKSIVAAGLRAGQLEVPEVWGVGRDGVVPERDGNRGLEEVRWRLYILCVYIPVLI
jgi:hypothetical protein